jgi:hypothetical protein
MQQHELDPVSLFSGLVFVLVAGGYTLTHTTDLQLHWLLVVPTLLIAVGATVIAMVVRGIRGQVTADPVCADPGADVQ